jgi:hypothetical protein
MMAIIILFLSTLIIAWDFGLVAINPETGSENDSNAQPILRGSEFFNWSQIEVLSEPIPGKNTNVLISEHPRIAVENNKIYMVWGDGNNTNGAGIEGEIFYRYFDGSSWSKTQVISEPVPGQNFSTGKSWLPSIAVENNKIYVAWTDANDTDNAGTDQDIFYRCNLTGKGWEDIQVISEPVSGMNINTRESTRPNIAVENGKIYIVWDDNSTINNAGSDYDILYRCNLTGSGWEDIQVISEPVVGNNINTQDSIYSALAVENSKIYVVWSDTNNTNGCGGAPTDGDIFYKCNLTGFCWEPVQVISEPIEGKNCNIEASGYPSIAVENGKIYVVWQDYNNTNGCGGDPSNPEIFYKCNLTGYGWEEVQVISEPVAGHDINIGSKFKAMIDVESGKIFVVWTDNNNTNNAMTDWDIFYRCNLTGSNWEDIEVVSEPVVGKGYNWGTSGDGYVSVKLGKIYVVWADWNDTNGCSWIDSDIHWRTTSFKLFFTMPNVTPTSGNTSTNFNFTIRYYHLENICPTNIFLNLSGTEYPVSETDSGDTNYMDGKDYFYNIKLLDIGVYRYQFYASDGQYDLFTQPIGQPIVYNTPPNITTSDNLTATEEVYYEVSYEYEDIDNANVGQSGNWNCSTNASWLSFNNITAKLNGTPSNYDVGKYWVNITIDDSIDIDFTNFTLSVIDINDDPVIKTNNTVITYEDDLYLIDYNATDIDSPIDFLNWTLDTNASSWLDIESSTGIISGIPANDNVGSYWINVSVNDSEGGLDFTNFTLTVLNINDPPEIITEDITTAIIDEIYKVDYEAVDIDPGPQNFFWSLNTNAIWLNIDSNTGILSGMPTIYDLGWYNINITVDDNCGGQDWHEFFLTVIKENLPPNITTEDVLSATVDELYESDYDATDIDTPLDKLRWSLNANASWLNINKITGMLTGTPALVNLGKYWVNVTVTDEIGAFDFHNFTLTVYLTPNLPPKILTEDLLFAVVGQEYSVDYDAEDDRTPVDKLKWFLKTEAYWLGIDENTGLLFGTPQIEHIGSYQINISVFDLEDGWDRHVFILQVTQEPIAENNAPILSKPGITPSEGDTETEFMFTVHYFDADNDIPTLIQVVIDNTSYKMTFMSGEPSNGTYEYSTKLSEGTHVYYFTASDGIDTVSTDNFTIEINKPGKVSDDETSWWWLILLIILIIIVILITLFVIIQRKRRLGEEQEPEQLTEEEHLEE